MKFLHPFRRSADCIGTGHVARVLQERAPARLEGRETDPFRNLARAVKESRRTGRARSGVISSSRSTPDRKSRCSSVGGRLTSSSNAGSSLGGRRSRCIARTSGSRFQALAAMSWSARCGASACRE